MEYPFQEMTLLRPCEILDLIYSQQLATSRSSTPRTFTPVTLDPHEAMAPPPRDGGVVVSVRPSEENLLVLSDDDDCGDGEEDEVSEVMTPNDEDHDDHFAVYRMIHSVYSPQIAADYGQLEESILGCRADKSEGTQNNCSIFPRWSLRRDPRILLTQRKCTQDGDDSESCGPKVAVKTAPRFGKSSRNLYPVVLKFLKHKELLAVMALSGPKKEYKLPIFSRLVPFRILRANPEHKTSRKITDSHVDVMDSPEFCRVSIRRYESRLTLAQMAIILGLENYNVVLTKKIEAAVFEMFEQLHGFHIEDSTWIRGIDKALRTEMVSLVAKFMRVYYPMLTPDLVEIIIKRGSYSRMQQHLRRNRKRKLKRAEGKNKRRRNQDGKYCAS